ncbi:unnamed protein product [Mytilus coruscus]|uniref:ATP-dependent DNA helicase n=1 Tax=Mytilus coruscus TaxID=42192 RepID=A0A6J8EAL1_MYTCO|nr:unnamed protein product [Mytilus coruscus]
MSREVGIEARTVEFTNHANRISESDYFALIRSLNKKQWEFFQHVTWFKTKHEPFYTFLTGGAGCGKSVVVKAIFQALNRHLCSTEGEDPDDIRILLCAPTGKAAYNINGLSIIAIGDFFQLKPVFDSWIFNDLSKEFAQLLNRLRQNQLTENDFAVLSTRTVSISDPTYRTNATHLFVENALVDNFNLQYISKLCSQKVRVKAVDTVCGDLPASVKTKLLWLYQTVFSSLPEKQYDTANLAKEVVLAIGMKYDLTANIEVIDGLTNGSTCELKLIECKTTS